MGNRSVKINMQIHIYITLCLGFHFPRKIPLEMQLLTPGSMTQAITSDIRGNSSIVHMKSISQQLIPFLNCVCWKILIFSLTTEHLWSGCILYGNKPQNYFMFYYGNLLFWKNSGIFSQQQLVTLKLTQFNKEHEHTSVVWQLEINCPYYKIKKAEAI